MRVFIVHAHPEPKSFNGALTRTATETLRATRARSHRLGSPRCRLQPGVRPPQLRNMHDANYFRQQAVQTYAATHNDFAPEIAAEMEKLFGATH